MELFEGQIISAPFLNAISKEVGGFSFNMEINVDTSEGISELIIKNKVKETINQIGAKITKEKLD